MLKGIKRISNPLTVIAIFAGLVEIVGTVLLPQVSESNQSIVLIFLLAFPCLLVILFFLTLNFNHKVLYAPSDFADEGNFIAIMGKQLTEVEARITQNVEKEINDKVSKLEDSLSQKETLDKVRGLIEEMRLDPALTEIDKLLEIHPSARAWHLKAMILSRQLDYRKAIDACNKGLDLSGNDSAIIAILHWNRACYKCLDRGDVNSVIEDLEEAILHDLGLSEKLLSDEDLISIRDDSKFKDFVKRFSD